MFKSGALIMKGLTEVQAIRNTKGVSTDCAFSSEITPSVAERSPSQPLFAVNSLNECWVQLNFTQKPCSQKHLHRFCDDQYSFSPAKHLLKRLL